jgi:predicted AlkP superfamily phosphohydrolase/phosphomutase
MMPDRSGRVVVFGLDGATFDLLLPWIDEGKLPTFDRLLNQGVHGLLDPAPNLRSAASWTSFYTGKNPGKHGIYEFYDFIPGNYSIRFIDGSYCREPSIWRLLTDQGLRSIVINVPMTYPAESIDGVILSGLDAPGTDSNGFCHPQNILGDLEARFGKYILEPGLTGFIQDNRQAEAVERLFGEIEQKERVMFHLMENDNWDLLTVVFRSLDAAQHCFWKYMDDRHPQHDPTNHGPYRDVIFRVYRQLDKILAHLIQRLEPEDTLLVMSDHGFGAKHPANNQLNAWLAGKDYLSYRKNNFLSPLQSASRRTLKNAYELIGSKLSRRQKEALVRIFPTLRNRVQSRLCFTGIDWSKTRAYSDTLFANIRINLKGREANGIVQPGADYDNLIEEIRENLITCQDQKTGEPLVSEVLHKDEIYRGPCSDKAPDLTIRWREDIKISGIKCDAAAYNESLPSDRPFIPAEDARVISGDHHRYGIFIGWGSKIKKGLHIEGAQIVDLVPTTFYLLQRPVPEDMDGKVLTPIFEDDHLSRNPLRTGGVGLDQDRKGVLPEYDKDEEAAIADRLRQLGYLE